MECKTCGFNESLNYARRGDEMVGMCRNCLTIVDEPFKRSLRPFQAKCYFTDGSIGKFEVKGKTTSDAFYQASKKAFKVFAPINSVHTGHIFKVEIVA